MLSIYQMRRLQTDFHYCNLLSNSGITLLIATFHRWFLSAGAEECVDVDGGGVIQLVKLYSLLQLVANNAINNDTAKLAGL